LFAAFHGPLLRPEGIGPAARPKNASVLLLPAAILPLGGGRIPGFEGSDGLEHLQKELVQVFGPRLLMLLEEEDQFAQQVTFTEGVQAIVEPQIAGEEVMHEPTLEPGEDTDGFNGLLTAFEMDGEEGQQRRTQDMQPMVDLVDRHAGLVGVEHGFFGQDLHQPMFIRFQRGVLLLPGGLQGRFADGIAEHLGAHLADPPAGSFLGVVEVGQQRAEVFPVLDGSFDVGGKGRRRGLLATGALLDLRPMFGAFELERGQIENLASLKINGGFLGEILAA